MRATLAIRVEDASGIAAAAAAGGADRLDLCSAPALDGLTPSAALIDRAAAGLPVHVLVRPRPGGFVLDDAAAALVASDIAAAPARGAAGAMVGAGVPEADPAIHTVGLGGYPARDGHVTLDAIVIDRAGGVDAVAALEDVVHAVSVARLVMERTPHTLPVGEGATRFTLDRGGRAPTCSRREAKPLGANG